MDKFYQMIRRISKMLTSVVCIALILCVIVLCVEIVLRKVWSVSIPGAHEYSEYFLAILSTIGLSQALLEQAHIRIDLLYRHVNTAFRKALDAIALVSLSSVAVMLTYFAYPVLSKSINNNALANTPLATPLWIPQSIWFAGLVWFATVSIFLSLYAAYLLIRKDDDAFFRIVTIHDETQGDISC